jgi:uncharacterized membrane protein YdfJ with MMPL/SSD domain
MKFIMAVVFGAFVVPAVMTLAGRWNWFPGRRWFLLHRHAAASQHTA